MPNQMPMVYVPMGQRHEGFYKPTVPIGYFTPKRCLVMLAGMLVSLTIILQILMSFRHAFSDMHLRTDIDGELVIIPKSTAHKHGALCLDSTSLPGYYIKRGIDDGERRWLLVIPHSTWCTKLSECHPKSEIPLEGTTSNAPVTLQFTGILSSDPTENEHFADWNMVRLIACDGASLLGNQTDVLTYSAAGDQVQSRLQSRGAAIFISTIDHLISTTEISEADEIVLYGDRSGSLSAVLYREYIRSRLPGVSKFTTLVHSGLLLGLEMSQYNLLPEWFRFHNIAGNGILKSCTDVTCLQARHFIHGSTTPVIIFTSETPAWPLSILDGCGEDCHEADAARISDHRRTYEEGLREFMSAKRRRSDSSTLIFIVTKCEYPIRTTYSLDDPTIGGKSIYSLLVRNLVRPNYHQTVTYIEESSTSCHNNPSSHLPQDVG